MKGRLRRERRSPGEIATSCAASYAAKQVHPPTFASLLWPPLQGEKDRAPLCPCLLGRVAHEAQSGYDKRNSDGRE